MTVTSENDAFFNNYNSSAAGTSGYAGKVYLGSKKVKGYKEVSPTGATYTVGPRDEDITESIGTAKSRYLTDAALRKKWDAALRKNGIDADPIQARAIWELSVDGASDWFANSDGQQKITPEQYLGWYAGGKKKKAPALPTRQVYQVPEAETDADINEFLQKRAGRTLQDTDRNEDWYNDLVKAINKLYSKGIVTTVQEVKNPKTGKMEKVVTQAPGFSKEQVEQKIVSAIESADPESVDRKQRLDFTKWFYGRGGQG